MKDRLNGTELPIETRVFENPEEYEEYFPQIRRTVRFVQQYEQTKSKGREGLLTDLGQSIVQKPQQLEYFFTNLDLLTHIKPRLHAEELKDSIVHYAEKSLSREKDFSSWSAEKIEELIRLSIDTEGVTRQAYERIAKALYESPRKIVDVIDLQYQSAWALATTQNPDVQKKIYQILCYDTEILPPESRHVFLYNLALFHAPDEHVRKTFALDWAVHVVGKGIDQASQGALFFESDRFRSRLDRSSEAEQNLPEYEQMARQMIKDQLYKRNKKRAEAIERELRKQFEKDEIDEKRAKILQFDILGGKPTRKPGGIMQYTYEVEELEKKHNAEKSQPWSVNLLNHNDDPLSIYISREYEPKMYQSDWESRVAEEAKLGFKKLTPSPIQITEDLQMEITGKGFDSHEQIQQFVSGVCGAFLDFEGIVKRRIHRLEEQGVEFPPDILQRKILGPLEAARAMGAGYLMFSDNEDVRIWIRLNTPAEKQGRLDSQIAYHRPYISLESVGFLREATSRVRQEIKDTFIRSVGSRGVLLTISDPVLRSMGYRQLFFQQLENDAGLTTGLVIDKQVYICALDKNFRLVLGDDLRRFNSTQDQAWLELFLLSHLKKLMCFEEKDIAHVLIGGEKQVAYYKSQTLGRNEHLRHLPSGQSYTPDAYNKCLKSNLPIKSLYKINEMRAQMKWGGTFDTGFWTYVSPTEKADDQSVGPVKMAIKNASDDIRHAIPLHEVSKEELERIEKLILQELELT